MSEYNYPLFNDKDKKVICQLCGKPFLVISPRHLEKHNITHGEYKYRFPDAPLYCSEFTARGKYGKEKVIFVSEELQKIEEEIEEEIEDDPIIEDEIDFDEVLKSIEIEKTLNICDSSKNSILEILQTIFTNVRKDYMIQIFDNSGRLEFETISDFSDPILKINIEFPNTFWHNCMSYIDPNRNLKLNNYGWKIIQINSINPSIDIIIKKIKESI